MGSAFDRLGEDELLVSILLRLDLHNVARMRLVCRSWYCILTSRSFLDCHREQQHPGTAWVVRMTRSSGRQSALLWRPFSGLPPEPTALPLAPPGVPSPMFVSHFTVSGLVCGTLAGWPKENTPRSRSLAVGNPLTNAWKVFQCVEEVEEVETMDVDPETGIYRIAVFNVQEGDTEETAYILQYNSGSESWVAGESPSNVWNFGYNHYDLDAMAWSRPLVRTNPLGDWDGRILELEDGCFSWPIRGFMYKGRRILVVHREGSKGGFRRVALSVLEKGEEPDKWLALYHGCIREILGETIGDKWPLGDVDCPNENWMAHLAGDVIVVSSRMYPLLAFHLVDKKWECSSHSDEELSYLAKKRFPDVRAYTFTPSFTARP
ncbi:hypothetical protein SELMODRAFT_417877 [Selaginella moellendorffii]|uniref:F-box domain-containing protein n=1 Tax=Selaginella moellendorffii TaxID=88036 RepID=D8S3Y1_SELML|nr:hypothetical protein SELMODRAFT_417877 [Selaginella moellendorffii]